VWTANKRRDELATSIKQPENKATIYNTSPTLCTPITPFPTIGDAAYHQRAREPSQDIGNMHKKFDKIVHMVLEISLWTEDRHTDRQTYSS